MEKPLANQVAVVTGASRGVGKGIAIGLGEAGATVYITGRTVKPGALPGTIGETAEEVTRAGGRGIAVACDHADDIQVKALFERVRTEAGRLDILVNNAFAIPEGKLLGPFWELPLSHWDTMHTVGLRSHYVATWYATSLLMTNKGALVVHVSSAGAKIQAINVAYGVGKAGVDRMARDMARELAPHGVCVVSLWPGVVKTERLLLEPDRLGFDPSRGESPLASGRAVVAIATDPNRMERSGKAWMVGDLARAYGFTDIDGSVPAPILPARANG